MEQPTRESYRCIIADDHPMLMAVHAILLEPPGLSLPIQREVVGTTRQLADRVGREKYDLIISDSGQASEFEAVDCIERLRASGDQTPFILATGRLSEELLKRVGKLGNALMLEKALKVFIPRLNHYAAKLLRATQAQELKSSSPELPVVRFGDPAVGFRLLTEDPLRLDPNPLSPTVKGISASCYREFYENLDKYLMARLKRTLVTEPGLLSIRRQGQFMSLRATVNAESPLRGMPRVGDAMAVGLGDSWVPVSTNAASGYVVLPGTNEPVAAVWEQTSELGDKYCICSLGERGAIPLRITTIEDFVHGLRLAEQVWPHFFAGCEVALPRDEIRFESMRLAFA